MFVLRAMKASKLKWLWLAMAAVSAVAAANPGLEPIQWIQKIQQAAQRLNYSGTFVYLQQGGQAQTSKITHVYEGGFERERLEMLEGPPVVVVRVNEEVRTYLPDVKTVMVEKRPARATFPFLGAAPRVAGATADPRSLPGFADHYTVRKWDTQRIAGLDCQVLLLEPKDGMRYTHKLWADTASGLLLKAQAFNEKGDVVEQIAFTQVEIGGPVERYQAHLAKKDGGRDWKVAQAQVWDASLAESGWKIESGIPGFHKVSEMRRNRGDGSEVGQVVFSDGLTSVSVFVEPSRDAARLREGNSTHGAVNVYRRKVADHLVTVLGEAPAACVTRIAKAVEFKPATASVKPTP